MYNVISRIIDHIYQGNYNTAEQYIYPTACALIVILSIIFVDLFYRLFRTLIKK